MASKGDLQAALASLRVQHECGGGCGNCLCCCASELGTGRSELSEALRGPLADQADDWYELHLSGVGLANGTVTESIASIEAELAAIAAEERRQAEEEARRLAEEAAEEAAARRQRPHRRGCSSELAACAPRSVTREGSTTSNWVASPPPGSAIWGLPFKPRWEGIGAAEWQSMVSCTTPRPPSPNSTSAMARGSGMPQRSGSVATRPWSSSQLSRAQRAACGCCSHPVSTGPARATRRASAGPPHRSASVPTAPSPSIPAPVTKYCSTGASWTSRSAARLGPLSR